MTGNDDLLVELSGDPVFDTPVPEPVEAHLDVDLDADEDRYSRFRLIPWWDQDLLRKAKILVIGAGALGNEIVKNLALLGIGNVLVCDMDTIENTNLSRSVLFRQADEGSYKADVIARSARDVNPDVNVHGLVANVIHDIGLGVYRAFDMVIGGLDNREARLHINQSCWKVNRPWIDGAIEVVNGIARVFIPPDGPCYECTMNDLDRKLLSMRKSCSLLTRSQMLEGKVPTTPTTASVIAGIQCQEAVKLIHGRDDLPVLSGKGFYFNGLTHDSFVIAYTRREECYSHVTYETVEETDWKASELKIGDLIEHVRSRMGSDAVVELEREIVSSLDCVPCGTSEPVYTPLSKLTEEDGRCPSCGEIRQISMTHALDEDPKYLDMSLSEIGVPPLDIVTGRVGFDMVHMELSGDRSEILGWMDPAVVESKGVNT